jgi:hypothetical protein
MKKSFSGQYNWLRRCFPKINDCPEGVPFQRNPTDRQMIAPKACLSNPKGSFGKESYGSANGPAVVRLTDLPPPPDNCRPTKTRAAPQTDEVPQTRAALRTLSNSKGFNAPDTPSPSPMPTLRKPFDPESGGRRKTRQIPRLFPGEALSADRQN